MATITSNNAVAAVIGAALMALAGATSAAEQQASFAVAITLHSISKPMMASMLCPQSPRLDRLNVAITVSCPGVSQEQARLSADPESQNIRRPGDAPTVVVSF